MSTASLAAGQLDLDEIVALLDADGDDAALAALAKSSSEVFFTVPCWVAKKRSSPDCST
jgi:hypothetical protein